MVMNNHCPGINNLSHDMQVLALGTCTACTGTTPNPPTITFARPAARPQPTATPSARVPDTIQRAGANVIAVTNPTHRDDLTTFHFLKGSWR